jgi:hypothetical protein
MCYRNIIHVEHSGGVAPQTSHNPLSGPRDEALTDTHIISALPTNHTGNHGRTRQG